jgi:tetratricopeptide (TPR) repeat protein
LPYNLCQCTWVDGACKATSDKDCKATRACHKMGACTSVNGICSKLATNDQDCQESDLCDEFGLCSAVDGWCLAQIDQQCKKSSYCKSLGLCTQINHACQASENQECQKSRWCKKQGLCSLKHGTCQALTDQDCAQAKSCSNYKQCFSVAGRCEMKADSDEICQQGGVCKKLGQCSSIAGICQASSQLDCLHSKQCKYKGLCSLFQGHCRFNLQVDSDLYGFANKVFKAIQTNSSEKTLASLVPPIMTIEDWKGFYQARQISRGKKVQMDKTLENAKYAYRRYYPYLTQQIDRKIWEGMYPKYVKDEARWERWQKKIKRNQQRKKEKVDQLLISFQQAKVDVSGLQLIDVIFWKKRHQYNYHFPDAAESIVLILNHETTHYYLAIDALIKTAKGAVLIFDEIGLIENKPDYPMCKKDQHCQRKNQVCVGGMCRSCGEDKDCKQPQHYCDHYECVEKKNIVQILSEFNSATQSKIDELLNPDSPKHALLTSREQALMSNQLKRVKSLRKIIDKDPKNKRRESLLFRIAELEWEIFKSRYFLQYKSYYKQLLKNDLSTDPQPKFKLSTTDHTPLLKTFENFLKEFPNSKYADRMLYYLAQSSIMVGHYDQGIKHMNQLVKTYPKSEYVTQAHLVLAEFYFHRKQIRLADKQYSAILKIENQKGFEYPLALYKKALIYNQEKKYRASIQSIQDAIGFIVKNWNSRSMQNLSNLYAKTFRQQMVSSISCLPKKQFSLQMYKVLNLAFKKIKQGTQKAKVYYQTLGDEAFVKQQLQQINR